MDLRSFILSKNYTNEVIAQLEATLKNVQLEVVVVDKLPEVGETRYIYLVPANLPDESNIYNEFIWVNVLKTFEQIGTTKIDLSEYSKIKDVESKILETKTALLSLIDLKADTASVAEHLEDLKTSLATLEVTLKNYISTEDLVLRQELEALISSTKTSLTQALNKSLAELKTELVTAIDTLSSEIKTYTDTKVLALQQELTESLLIVKEALNRHSSDFANPHKVTKDQLGLSNVENTSDLDKPLSNAAKDYIDTIVEEINSKILDMDTIKTEVVGTVKPEINSVNSKVENLIPAAEKLEYEIAPTVSKLEATAEALQAWVENKDYLQEVDLAGYATEAWVENKKYLTEHQDLSSYALKTDLFNKDYNDLINKPDLFSGNYEDLSNKPEIPSIEGLAKESWVEEKGYLTEHQNISHLALKSEIPSLEGYAKLENIPDVSKFITEIPADYITETKLNNKGYLTAHQDISHLAKKSEVPTKVSQLENDKAYTTTDYVTTYVDNTLSAVGGKLTNYYTKAEVDLKEANLNYVFTVHNHDQVYAALNHEHSQYLTVHQSLDHKADKVHLHNEYALTEHQHDQYLTEHQSLEGYAKKVDLFSGKYEDLSNKPEIPSIEGLASEEFVETKLSELQIDKYSTKEEVTEAIQAALSAIGIAEGGAY